METLNFGLELKDISEQGVITGYGAIFNNVDEYGDRIVPGAFGKSLLRATANGSLPLMLWNHKSDEPIGVWSEMVEDKKGLKVKGQLVMDVPRAAQTYALLKAGAMRGLSIGYRTISDSHDGNVRLLKEIDLWEVSPVTFPANAKATITSVKSGEPLAAFAARLREGVPPSIKEFEEILREAGFPKTLATQIASVGYAKAIRSESEGKANVEALRALKDAMSGFLPQTQGV